jgi:hypothetical protein
MGLLLSQEYWSHATNQMWDLLPPRDRPMGRDRVIEFLEVAQRTLDQLVDDKDFYHDLHLLAKLAAAAPGVPPKETAEFRNFIDRFLEFERTLFLQSGMNEDAVSHLLGDIACVAEQINDIHVDIYGMAGRLKALRERLRVIRAEEREFLQSETRCRYTWRIVKGCAIVGVDGGTAAAANLIFPILGGIVSAGPALLSIKVGAAMVSDALKDRI